MPELDAALRAQLAAAYDEAAAAVRAEFDDLLGSVKGRRARRDQREAVDRFREMAQGREARVRERMAAMLTSLPASERDAVVDAYVAQRNEEGAAQRRTAFRRLQPPNTEMPAVVAANLNLGRNENVAVTLTHIEVYSAGLRLRLLTRGRPGQHAPFLPTSAVFAEHQGVPAASRPLVRVSWPAGSVTAVEHAAAITSTPANGGDPAPTMISSVSGSDEELDETLWLTPLPPLEDLTLTFGWPEQQLPETVTALPVAALRAAAGEVQTLWPDAPHARPATVQRTLRAHRRSVSRGDEPGKPPTDGS